MLQLRPPLSSRADCQGEKPDVIGAHRSANSIREGDPLFRWSGLASDRAVFEINMNARNKKFEFDFRGSGRQNPPTSLKSCALFPVRKEPNYEHSAVAWPGLE